MTRSIKEMPDALKIKESPYELDFIRKKKFKP
jgi:hypothetical protein